MYTPDDIEMIKEEYPGIAMWSDTHVWVLYKNIIKEHTEPIQEFLTTIVSEKTIEEFLRRNFKNVSTILRSNQGNKIRIIFSNLNKSSLDEINKYMDSFGWFPAMIGKGKDLDKYSEHSILSNTGDNNISVEYEAHYDSLVDVQEKYLYHICPDIAWINISTVGLTPKTQSKLSNHPRRIYLIHQFNNKKLNIAQTAQKLFDSCKNQKYIRNMYVLRIDVSKLKNNIFYEDPNFKICDAVWTNENIAPYAIKVVEQILVNPNAEDKHLLKPL